MRLSEQLIKILHGAEFRRDGTVIADVISAVHTGVLIHRIEPDHIRAEELDVIEFLRHAAQVADAIPVCIHKALGIDLIHHRLLKPVTHR